MVREDSICVDCRHALPVTNFHFDKNPALKKVLFGRANIEQGTALFRFEKKGPVQHLIHELKYKGHQGIGEVLGDWLGGELATLPEWQAIDMIIPVPIHKKKLRERGFNQVTKFGKRIAFSLNAEYREDLLIKVIHTKTQTKKNRSERFNNNPELYKLVHPELLENKHVLIVDDLITTGATLEGCICVLNQAKNLKISIATMAIA
ncbi:ComF family protein [Gaetbulibacter aestuarii]|uniref:Phosphoribosyltransferase family protein n=2 Tax=Gaetbulibacter aestuarii TaxID=1502358 RepID=A0ABW7N0J6_9FLAO